MLGGELDAGTAAFRVGYESPSQFSREYRRLYGAPPLRHVRGNRESTVEPTWRAPFRATRRRCRACGRGRSTPRRPRGCGRSPSAGFEHPARTGGRRAYDRDMGAEVTMSESGKADRDQRLEQLERALALLGRPEPAKARRNWDAYAAVIATLIGLLALVVAAYTAHVQRQQLRAQVWPHIEVDTANVFPTVGFHVANGGTGPARVIAVRVTVDGKPVVRWDDAKNVLGAAAVHTIMSQLGGTVVPVGKETMIFRPYDEAASAPFVQSFLSDKHPIVVTICYCSVLDECWVTSSHGGSEAVSDPDACPITSAERFHE
jgi:hypothetical protein